ncbi:hypothetical protein [Nitrosomonas sp.]|uniref:hypothetical protein n=1 Tax=Nitrosomonas sp. TaxID=42353 RepID=UPI0025DDB1BD|nr:hypothetical protein [Nitrosomonas sp.]
MTVAYAAVLGMLIQGHALDKTLSDKLMKLVKTGKLPFHAVTFADLQPPRQSDLDPPRAILTGTLVGAQVGLSGIPQRFLDGLEDVDTLKSLAMDLAVQAVSVN